MKDNITTIKLKKVNGKLVHVTAFDKTQYKEFVDALSEGQIIEIFLEANAGDGTKAQLAKIHACIRKLASEIGYTFEDMKLTVKQKSGLVRGDLWSSEGYAKSFADCSKEELSLVIETLNDIGKLVNLSF